MSATALRPFVFPADVDSATTEAECRKLWELATLERCVELGAWKGRTAITMGQSAAAVHSIDHFRGDMHTGFAFTLIEYLKNLQRYGMEEKVVTHIGRFKDVIPTFVPHSFGLVFCDGVHTREAMELQLDWAKELVTWGGIVAVHDYGVAESEGFAVAEVVDALPNPLREVVDSLAVVQF